MKIDIPIMAEVDVLVVGGTAGAVQAALAARRNGARVFCVTPFSYLGEDVCAWFRFWPDPAGLTAAGGDRLGAQLFPEYPAALPSPLHVKRTLERALLAQNISFLFLCHPVQLLHDAQGRPAGLVIANRSGFQAVAAKVIIDATERALVARLAGAAFRAHRPGCHWAERIVVGAAGNDRRLTVEELPVPVTANGKSHPAFRLRRQVDMPGCGPAEFAAAETGMRRSCWHPGQVVTAEKCLLIVEDSLVTAQTVADFSAAAPAALAAVTCPAAPILVLGAYADVRRDRVAEFLELGHQLALGDSVGVAAAGLAADSRAGLPVRAAVASAAADTRPEIVRCDRYFRFAGAPTVPFDLNPLPRLAACEVLVVGGGTGGAAAGIAAGRAGARTLVLEPLPALGGVGTEGQIGDYWFGNRVGFTDEMDQAVARMGGPQAPPAKLESWNLEWKKQWLLTAAAEAGTQLWFGTAGVAAARDGDRVCGVVAAGPYGLGLVTAAAVIDATGHADVVAAAGGPVTQAVPEHLAVQGAGLSPATPEVNCANTDYLFSDDGDVVDATCAFVLGREKFGQAFDLARMVNTRERRQIVGDFTLQPPDFYAGRTYADTITIARSNFDTHGFTIHPLFFMLPPDEEPVVVKVPYRCLLPAGLEGVLATGLGVSAHRDALPVVRMQPDVQNQGYAAGLAAARAVRAGCTLRQLPMRPLQQALVEKGILPARVLTETDALPVPAAAAAAAPVPIGTARELGLVFADPAGHLPRLRRDYAACTDPERRVRLAQLLAFLGDAGGAESLLAAVDGAAWDGGWNYTGMGQFGRSCSPLDARIIALGRTGSRAALPVLLRKLETLPPDAAFSHVRAVCTALERLPCREAVPLLERWLQHPGAAGHARADCQAAVAGLPKETNDTGRRNAELKELFLARALVACDPGNVRGRAILAAYAAGVHGPYARFALAPAWHGRSLAVDPAAATAIL
ncbi:MAG: FAD-dependent oxidoreductase [Lentisphaeria bacterium]